MDKQTIENLLAKSQSTTSDSEMITSLKKARELAFKMGFDLKNIEAKKTQKVEPRGERVEYTFNIPKKVLVELLSNLTAEFPVRVNYGLVTSSYFCVKYYYDSNFDFDSFKIIIENCLSYLSFAKKKSLSKTLQKRTTD